MDTNRLKRFATEARSILNQGVAQRFITLGFNPDGTCQEEPVERGGGATFMGDVVSMDFYRKWISLKHAVETKGITEVVEEAAYTWFNRLMAIRIMVKNALISPVLEYESDDVRVPLIVTEARQGRYPNLDEQTREKLMDLLDDDSKTSDQFRVLIVAYCHSNPIINKCFGGISDYTELLLPSNILAEGGFVDLLNNTQFISEEDFHSPELIGWLYQFYISEKKDDVFASFKKGKKAEPKDIPAATQIFTPNWIVKYMVQNTVGRIYLDNNPYSDIKDGMKYLVEPSEKPSADSIFQFDDIHDLTCADLACGSGHILNEAFDLLYQIYLEEGYNRRKAVEDIFKYNLTGIDLDTRAKQLAQFALLMKACQKDNSFADAHCMPRVYDMPEPYPYKDNLRDTLPHFYLGGNQEMIEETIEAIELMDNAQNYGSIMKFDISERTRNAIAVRVDEYENEDVVSEPILMLLPYMRIILALTQKYAALCMNPPYMGGGNMNAVLSKYVKDEYANGKSDLATVFVELMPMRLAECGKYGFIIPPSWMFLSTFEDLRRSMIEHQAFDSLLHLSRGVFGADFGASSAVLTNVANKSAKGTYFRLIERTFQEFDQKHLCELFEKTLENNDFKFLFSDYTKDIDEIRYNENGARVFYSEVRQDNFEKIPGCPIGYWVSDKIKSLFIGRVVDNVAYSDGKNVTGDNDKYLRLMWEVSLKRIGKGRKWMLQTKGGEARRWYGNTLNVIAWSPEDIEFYHKNSMSRVIKEYLWYKEGITWSKICSSRPTFRLLRSDSTFDEVNVTPSNPNDLLPILGIVNTKMVKHLLDIVNPTFSVQTENVLKMPFTTNGKITEIVSGCLHISRQDWDSHETSCDFKLNELLRISEGLTYDQDGSLLKTDVGLNLSLEEVLSKYKTEWTDRFMQLHANEEELNRQFIDIYGLQDELTPDVPLDEITILQQGEISIENNELKWHEDVVMKQFISYAVGCMMGRYSIDKPGLILANQGDGLDEYNILVPNSRFEVDDDGIIPLMASDTDFADNATLRFKQWLTVTFGGDSLVENLNYIEKCLGKTIDDYFVKDFWTNHKKMYSNRPIYWMFRSKKGAFQCIAYMHRMNPYTAEAIRTKYLLPHIEWLVNQKNDMLANAANLSTRERKQLDNIIKQIDECREYHDRLHVIADQQIAFELDDGVVVNYAKFGDVLQKLK